MNLWFSPMTLTKVEISRLNLHFLSYINFGSSGNRVGELTGF